LSILSILQFIAVLGTLATGIVSLIKPNSVQGFTGLRSEGQRGITEIRAILGATFVGLALAAYFLDHSIRYPMLGYVYLSIAIGRAISIFIDKSAERSNWISLIAEVVFGVVLIL